MKEVSDKQKLIDIMFDIGLTIHEHSWFKGKSSEEVAEWIASQLEQNGFETKPIGSSWGMLVK